MVECFLRAGVSHMETVTLRRPSLRVAVTAYERLGRDVWTRPAVGTAGNHVYHVTTVDQLRSALLFYAESGQSWLMAKDAQNFNTEGLRHSFRVIVLQDKPLVALEHIQLDPNKPCNVAQGAIDKIISLSGLPEGVIRTAVSAVRSVGLQFGGVDLAVEGPAVFEVNVHPSLGWHLETAAIPWVHAQLAIHSHKT